MPVLFRGEPEPIRVWIDNPTVRQTLLLLLVIGLGCGAFGFAVGCWRHPLQGVYAAVKLPLVMVITTYGNALLNGMLAPLLGLNISFRQSLFLILLSFVIASALLGSFSSIALFMILNLPAVSGSASLVSPAYAFMQLTLASMIAFAGIMANLRLYPVLRECAGNKGVAIRVLLAWLAGNLLLGSQVCWMLRPFVGRPDLPLEFLGPGLHQGNFFETIFENLRDLVSTAF